MSRRWRSVLSDRLFFITCRVRGRRQRLCESEFAVLAEVVRERRKAHRFLLTAWVILRDHWHAIIFPHSPLTVSRVMESIKVSLLAQAPFCGPAAFQSRVRQLTEMRGQSGRTWARGPSPPHA